jgi:hypothetical protein
MEGWPMTDVDLWLEVAFVVLMVALLVLGLDVLHRDSARR